MNDYAVCMKNVSKIYKLKNKGVSKYKINFYALKNITFNVKRGDVVGIFGSNGSGKSTLSSILSGISSPDEGSIEIYGEQSLISINTGLNEQLTGIENIKFKGALLGLSTKNIQCITSDVINLAGLGEFIYQPVKNYSSGMKSRLGFSISVCLNPDIIIVDEALSVGDKAFADECIKKFEEFKKQQKTIFFISHSLSQIKSFCISGIWIEGGRLIKYAPIDETISEYSNHIEALKRLTESKRKKYNDNLFKSRIEGPKKFVFYERKNKNNKLNF